MHSAWLLPLAIPITAYVGRMGLVALKSVFDERITDIVLKNRNDDDLIFKRGKTYISYTRPLAQTIALSPQQACGDECRHFGSFRTFYKDNYEDILLGCRCIWFAAGQPPWENAYERLRESFTRIHDGWSTIYESMSDVDRRADLWYFLSADAIPSSAFSRKMPSSLGRQLGIKGNRNAIMPPSGDEAESVICGLAGSVARRLSNKECFVFLSRFFGEIPDEAIARRARLTPDTVAALNKKFAKHFKKLRDAAVKRDPRLSAILLDLPDTGRS